MARPTNTEIQEREALFKQGKRKCNLCKRILPLSHFGPQKEGANGLRSQCVGCRRPIERTGARRRFASADESTRNAVRKRKREQMAEWRTTNAGIAWRLRQEALRITREYGLLPEAHAELLRSCSGQCQICGTKYADVRQRPPHIDHDHKTGRVRGVLCANCNTALGKFHDDPTLLRAALAYLRKHT